MHPQAFLKTFWRIELRPQIFVAMSFDEKYKSRFDNIIKPAISAISIKGEYLKPYRVDLSKSGDSILTDITDGIAHSQLVLADVSSIGKDSVTDDSYRNGNVMYEVGLALACRHPSEVLLIRDDRDPFLFDVSSIPHMNIDFTNNAVALEILKDGLLARLNERKFAHDARIKLAVTSLTKEEKAELIEFADGRVRGREQKGGSSLFQIALSRLLDKQLIKLVGEFEDGLPAYKLTPLGLVVAQIVKSYLVKFKT